MYKYILSIVLFLILISCGSTPNDVLDKDDMTSLLIDIHKGEAYMEINSNKYYTDSLRKTVKQSVFLKHGITQAQFDTSLVWYGHHIEKYIEIYNSVIKELEKEDKNLIAQARREGNSLMAAGDSVDMWNKEQLRLFAPNMGEGQISFDYKASNDFKNGDRYQWSFRIQNSNKPIQAYIGVDYKDGSIAYNYSIIDNDGWNNLILQTDSTKNTRRVYGYINIPKVSNRENIFVDSISLVRTRLNKVGYNLSHKQRLYEYKQMDKTSKDTVTINTFGPAPSFANKKR